MPASRASRALALLLLLLPGAAAAAAGCPALRSKAELDAFSASNSPLRKAVFLSKLGKSSLCDKLLAKYAGRLGLEWLQEVHIVQSLRPCCTRHLEIGHAR